MGTKPHRYRRVHCTNADYIILETQDASPFWGGYRLDWVEHTRWMIPGTNTEHTPYEYPVAR